MQFDALALPFYHFNISLDISISFNFLLDFEDFFFAKELRFEFE